MFCMSKYPGAKFAREFGRKRNAKPISFSARRNFGLRRKSVRSSKLCPLGEIVLKAKIAFQKVLGEIHFTQDLVWVKLARRNAHTKHEFPAKLPASPASLASLPGRACPARLLRAAQKGDCGNRTRDLLDPNEESYR